MSDLMMAAVYLVLAAGLFWIRQTREMRPWQRRLLLILAIVLAYPAVDLLYIATKRFIAGRYSLG